MTAFVFNQWRLCLLRGKLEFVPKCQYWGEDGHFVTLDWRNWGALPSCDARWQQWKAIYNQVSSQVKVIPPLQYMNYWILPFPYKLNKENIYSNVKFAISTKRSVLFLAGSFLERRVGRQSLSAAIHPTSSERPGSTVAQNIPWQPVNFHHIRTI